jgi:hypothetical protein
MLALDADAPKPPAYPFSYNSFKEREDNKLLRSPVSQRILAIRIFRFSGPSLSLHPVTVTFPLR